MKKKFMSWLMIIILMVGITIFGFDGNIVNAATVNDSGTNSGIESAVNFTVGDVVTGNLSESDVADFYGFTVSDEGRLDLKYFTEIGVCFSRIYNEDGQEIWDSGLLNWDNVTHSLTYKTSAYLRKGKYYLTINKYNDYTGGYKVTTDFVTSNSNSDEPNDSFATAKSIILNSVVNGIIDEEEETDIFKFTVSSSCDLKLKMTVDGQSSKFSAYVYDVDGNKLWNDGDTFKNWDSSLTATKVLSLDKGTYYLVLSQYNYDSSMYSFKLSIEKTTQIITLKNSSKTYTKASVKKAKKTFSIGAKAKGKLTYKVVNGKKYISVSNKGRVTIKKNIPKGTYQIKITAKETPYYKSATKTFKIKIK